MAIVGFGGKIEVAEMRERVRVERLGENGGEGRL